MYKVFESIYKCVRVNDVIKGGISGDIELKSALHIKILWVDETLRLQKIGENLLIASLIIQPLFCYGNSLFY